MWEWRDWRGVELQPVARLNRYYAQLTELEQSRSRSGRIGEGRNSSQRHLETGIVHN
jgi:hypothetical protein